MAEGKYGKYFIKNPISPGKFCDRLMFFSRQYESIGEKNFSVLWNCIAGLSSRKRGQAGIHPYRG